MTPALRSISVKPDVHFFTVDNLIVRLQGRGGGGCHGPALATAVLCVHEWREELRVDSVEQREGTAVPPALGI